MGCSILALYMSFEITELQAAVNDNTTAPLLHLTCAYDPLYHTLRKAITLLENVLEDQ